MIESSQMPIAVIPKKFTQKDDLVIIPRKEYEEFLKLRSRKEIKLTSAQKQALVRARKNLTLGKFLTLNELKQKLGFTN